MGLPERVRPIFLPEPICEHLRTIEISGEHEMKQLALHGVTPFPPEPIDAPDDVVTACPSEADAVRWCIDYALASNGMSLRAIARLCGWRSASFLSEIASEANEKTMPEKRIRKFTLATGCRLLEQFHGRQETIRKLSGKQTATDRRRAAVALMLREAA